jgi:hypothetical protein
MEISTDYLLSVIGKKQLLLEVKDAQIAQLKAELAVLKAKDEQSPAVPPAEAG